MKKITSLFSICFILFCANNLFAQKTATEFFDNGKALFDKEKYKEALVEFDKACELDKNNEEAFYHAGWCYNELIKFDKAIERLLIATKLKSDYYEAYNELGYAYKQLGKNEEAIVALKKAVEIKDDYAVAHKQLGDVYQTLNKVDEAIDAFKSAYKNDDTFSAAAYNVGYLYNEKEQYENAIEWLNKAKAINEDEDTYTELGFANYQLNKNEDAIKAYKKAIEINPKSTTAYKDLGDVYRNNYKPAKADEAIKYYLKSLTYNSKSAGAYYGLGWCYSEKENYIEGIKMLNKAIQLNPEYELAYDELCYTYYNQKKYKESLATAKIAVAKNFKGNQFKYYMGLSYVGLKVKANATKIYNELKLADEKLAEALMDKMKEKK